MIRSLVIHDGQDATRTWAKNSHGYNVCRLEYLSRGQQQGSSAWGETSKSTSQFCNCNDLGTGPIRQQTGTFEEEAIHGLAKAFRDRTRAFEEEASTLLAKALRVEGPNKERLPKEAEFPREMQVSYER